MPMDRHLARRLARAALVAALAAASPVTAAETGPGLFADGNRLLRDDLYWAALLRYEQAGDLGFETPALHFNTGVAHYRAGQHARAREAFARAAGHPALAAVSEYNQGLTAMAAGDRGAALAHFRRVRGEAGRPELAELAGKAIDRLLADPVEAPAEPGAQTVAVTPAERPSGLYFDLEAGIGNDDNVYRSPELPYTDRSEPGNPVVNPVVRSGLYVPVDATATYAVGSFENEAFYGRYRIAGRYYQDEALSNADEFSHELSFGSTYHRRGEDRERRIFSAFSIGQHRETWFDPDDGLERVIDGDTAGERLSYVRYGPEIRARQSWKRLSFNVRFKGQILNYDAVGDLPEYDHEYLDGGVSVQYRITSTSLIRLEGSAWQRNYGERPAFSLDGTQSIDNESVRYDHLSYGATARQRITRWFWFGVRYARTERMDKYVGYYDYLRDGYGAELSLRIGERFKIRAEGWYRNYNYIRAFAYNDPAAGRKTLEAVDARLVGRFEFSNSLALVGSYEFSDVASNDLRIDHTRGQFMLGLRWRP